MFSRKSTTKFTENCSDKAARLKRALDSADAVLIGAGAGLSSASGLTYSGERFSRYFSDFHEKYGITDIYSGGFYPFETLEEYWAWWSRHIFYNRYDTPKNTVYANLLRLVEGKDYFVLTTNVDHQFQLAGFDKKRLFYTQGDYGLWQCSKPCCNETYRNEDSVREMIKSQKDMKIPSELIPRCPHCGAPLTMNLRSDETFVQDDGWYAAAARYRDFTSSRGSLKILFWELGVGMNTPVIIKYPFWQMTANNPNSVYACVNKEVCVPREIENQSILIDCDIARTLEILLGE